MFICSKCICNYDMSHLILMAKCDKDFFAYDAKQGRCEKCDTIGICKEINEDYLILKKKKSI